MSEQDGIQSSTKQRRSRKTNTANEEIGKQAPAAQRPDNDDREAWKAYWKQQGQPWRTEPEINLERQKYLAERRAIVPDIEKGIYPFKDIKLNRADVEWLLATHENGRGPIDWSDGSQGGLYERFGLDLRGANLQFTDLRHLPLSRTYGGLFGEEWYATTFDQREKAALHLEGSKLNWAHLEGSILNYAHFEGADLHETHLEGAELYRGYFGGKYVNSENLEFNGEQKVVFPTALPSADLSQTFFNDKTKLINAVMCDAKNIGVRAADTHWGGVPLASIDWPSIKMLGDEYMARQSLKNDGKRKNRTERLRGYQRAVRSNRQLAVELQAQGLNEDAARFAYRAQKLQRTVFQFQRKFGKYLFSGFLDLLAGYGYRPIRSVIWYFLVIFGFAIAFYVFGHLPFFPDTFVLSLTSFHGRGFFPGLGNETSLHNPLVVLAAIEAVLGLFIEISFIATFTQRFLGK